KLNIEKGLWLLFIIFIFISCLYSVDKINSLKFSIVFSFFVFIGIGTSCCINKKYYKYFVVSLLFCLSIHLIFTFLNIVNIEMVANICEQIYGYETTKQIRRWAYEYHNYSGISIQIGLNAIFQTLFISINFSYLLHTKMKNKIAIILLIMGWIALISTGKETFYLANIMSSIILLGMYLKRVNPKLFSRMIYAVIILFFVGFIVLIINFDTFMNLYYDKSIDSRFILYRDAIRAISQSPIIGNGINSIRSFSEHLTHNIYLQLTAETGIIGLTLFIIALGYSFVSSFNKYNFYAFLKLYLIIILIVDGFFGNLLFDYRFLIPFFIICFSTNCKESF
ncbi:MAG: O-antigen ligase family protein, partial [Erysipelotrichales bacterium]|nr:O-antigen ligase family protein [Erysipelotrichales bacterium]